MHQKGFANIVLVVVIVAILVGAVGYFAFVKKSEPTVQQPTPTSTDETANWKTYRSGDYGFEFNYPPSFSNEIGIDKFSSLTNTEHFVDGFDSSIQTKRLFFEGIENSSIEIKERIGIAVFDKSVKEDTPISVYHDHIFLEQAEKVTLNNLKAYLDGPTFRMGTPCAIVRSFVPYKKTTILLSIESCSTDQVSTGEIPEFQGNSTELKTLLSQILSTIKFTQ